MTILMYTGIVIGAIVVAYIIFMLVMALIPMKPVPEQPLGKAKQPIPDTDTQQSRRRKDVSFEVNGTSVSAWLFLPEDLSVPVPCIILGHGLGVTKDAGLDAYAVRFQEAGFAVFAFDYRHLGKSGGEPRQLVWIPYQQEDYAAAIEYARGLEEIDPARIALWGTSLSGGHVIVTAARDQEIACVVAQVPLLAGDAGGMEVVKRLGLGYILRMAFVHGVRDLVRSWLGLPPHKIPLAGKPGTVAVLADAGAWKAFEALAPDGFVNEICARIIIRMDKYHPIKHAAKVHCPVLLQICDQDITTTPVSLVKKAEKQLGQLAEVIHYPIDHFDIYLGANLESAVNDQVEFFKKHL
ncbi:MAG: alpha/beta fold hydrolase [Fidelibacterota bacterium]|nr:MAG: alpha/beta fold hydrolase [Candidatus Neomarinimicrobiota bacterium]